MSYLSLFYLPSCNLFFSVIIKSSEKGSGRGNHSASYACASLISAWQTAMSDGGLDVFFFHLAFLLVELDRQNGHKVNNYTIDFCEYAARQVGMYATHVYQIFVAAEERVASTLASTSTSQPINDVKELVGTLLSQLREIKGEWEHELHVRRHYVQISVRIFVDINCRDFWYVHVCSVVNVLKYT